MRFIPRTIGPFLAKAARSFPAVVLTGPRRAGKTLLLRKSMPKASYILLEDPDVVARLRADPQGFLDELPTPAILDEVQNVPELPNHVRARIDARPRSMGQWFITGSQEAPLMQGITESMAGRAAVLQLPPLSVRESAKVSMLHGGYPEVLAKPNAAGLWFASYMQTYLERDVRAVTAVRDLNTFRRFMALLAIRHGQVLNKTALAAPLGVSVPTITQWIGVLETTLQVIVVPPFYENFGKRLIKSPKIYFADSGMACHLLGIRNQAELARSPFAGAVLEGFVAAELIKAQLGRGQRRELYHFRDEQGLEVDFVLPTAQGNLAMIECKSTRTPVPRMTDPLVRLGRAMADAHPASKQEMVLLHQGTRTFTAIAPGVKAMNVMRYLASGS